MLKIRYKSFDGRGSLASSATEKGAIVIGSTLHAEAASPYIKYMYYSGYNKEGLYRVFGKMHQRE